MIENLVATLLCFSETVGKRSCRSLIRRNDNPLTSQTNFDFRSEFELDAFAIQDSTHEHWMASLANYQGFPLILGGKNNVKLEMLDTRKNPPEWVVFADRLPIGYRFQNQ